MDKATRLLTLIDAGARRYAKSAATSGASNKSSVVLLGLTHALSESYTGYFPCMYALNSAHPNFTMLYKTVFPAGLDAYRTPAGARVPSRDALTASLAVSPSITSTTGGTLAPPQSKSIFTRCGMSSTAVLALPAVSDTHSPAYSPDRPLEEMIVAGTTFGSLLPSSYSARAAPSIVASHPFRECVHTPIFV
ncbi:hypothetical protein C8J57DRAFT_1522256 [Mycena rebaudengoi]|nr:hypothetical protein C8J57DRAFT_1522256 [Mycena rebaudengoi]